MRRTHPVFKEDPCCNSAKYYKCLTASCINKKLSHIVDSYIFFCGISFQSRNSFCI